MYACHWVRRALYAAVFSRGSFWLGCLGYARGMSVGLVWAGCFGGSAAGGADDEAPVWPAVGEVLLVGAEGFVLVGGVFVAVGVGVDDVEFGVCFDVEHQVWVRSRLR